MKTAALSVVIGIFFGAWPFVMRFSGISNPFVAAFILNFTTMLVLFPMAAKDLNWKILLSFGVLMGVVAGVINGIGHGLNSGLVVDKKEELSRFGAIIPAVCVIVAVIGGFWIYGEPMNWKKITGVCTLILGIVIVATS